MLRRFIDSNLSKEDIEQLKNLDLLDALLKEFGASFPEFKRVLIDERDHYLTYSLQKASQPMPNQFQPGGIFNNINKKNSRNNLKSRRHLNFALFN